jgi:hypothetical protein
VSDYEYDYDEPAGAGIDTGSLGRDPYLYDPEMTQAAADAAAESVHQAYYPIVADQQQRLANMEQLVASQLAARDMEAQRQLAAEDQQLAEQAMKIAGQRLERRSDAGWFEQNRGHIREELLARPGPLPDAAMDETREQIADGLELAVQKLHGEAVEALQRRQDAVRASEIDEMKSALDRTHSIRALKRSAQKGRLSCC